MQLIGVLMRKRFLPLLCMIALLSFVLLMDFGKNVGAYKEGYSVNDYVAITTPTMDGKWTSTDEWNDAEGASFAGGNAVFRMKFVSSYPSWVNQYYIIELFNDTTDDNGDYLQICYATATTFGGTPTGGNTPQTDCIRIDYYPKTGEVKVYKGTGTGWTETTDYTWPDHVEAVSTMSASPLNGNSHRIYEFKIEHIHFGIQPEMWIRVAAYDASRTAVQAWPDGSSVNVPDDWGLVNVFTNPIPENINLLVALPLSSIPVLIAIRRFKKIPKL